MAERIDAPVAQLAVVRIHSASEVDVADTAICLRSSTTATSAVTAIAAAPTAAAVWSPWTNARSAASINSAATGEQPSALDPGKQGRMSGIMCGRRPRSTIKIGPLAFERADYDAEHDVLYLHVGEPEQGEGEETPEGHVIRYAPGTQRIVGLTLLGRRQLLERDGRLVVTIPDAVETTADEFAAALPRAERLLDEPDVKGGGDW